jgi:hypothetical protein
VSDVLGDIEAAYNEVVAQSDSSPESTSSEVPETASADDAAPATEETAAPQTTDPPAEPQASEPELKGSLPVARHKEILEKTRREYDEQLTQLGWAKAYKPEQVQQTTQLFELAERDPVAFARLLAAADPRIAEAFGQAAAPAAVPEAMPEPDVLLENGVMVYGHERLHQLMEWKDRQTRRDIEPVLQTVRAQQAWGQATQSAQSKLADARTWPEFTTHELEMKPLVERGASLEAAYRQVVVPKILAREQKIREETRAQVLAELRAKPTTSERPAGLPAMPAGGGMSRPSTIEEIIQETVRELSER